MLKNVLLSSILLCSSVLCSTELDQIDINSKDVQIKLMGELEGRSMIFKIKDADGKNLAVFKPNSGSTLFKGEYASYKLSRLLGLEIYSPTRIAYMTPETQKKALSLVESVKFNRKKGEWKKDLEVKEENRKIIAAELKRNIEKAKNLDGALKIWIDNLMFYTPLGTKKGLRQNRIYRHLKASGPQPPHTAFILSQCTSIFEPKGCVEGWGYKDEVAQDMSSILVLDAVLGNSDRFAGGNLHFTSTDGDVETKKGMRIFKKARLFSLDNGAVLRPKDRTGYKNLTELEITRFAKPFVQELKELKKMDESKLRKELGIGPEEFEVFKANLDITLAYIDEMHGIYKEDVWFKTGS